MKTPKPLAHIERVAGRIPFIQNVRKVALAELARGRTMVKSAEAKLAKCDKDQSAAMTELESLAKEQ